MAIADVLELSVSALESMAEESGALLDLMTTANPNRDAIAAPVGQTRGPTQA